MPLRRSLRKEVEDIAGPQSLTPLGVYYILTSKGGKYLALNSYVTIGLASEIRTGLLELLSQGPVLVREILVRFDEESELFEDTDSDSKRAMVSRFLRVLKTLEKGGLIRRENYQEHSTFTGRR